MVKKAERNMREFMSEWQFWMGVAYFGLASVVVALFFINGRTSRSLASSAREQAVHQAEIKASANAAETQCIGAIPELRRINGFLRAEKDVALTLVENSKYTVASTPKSSSQYKIRLANLKRLETSLPAVKRVRFPIPDRTQCKARAAAILKAG